MLCKNLINLIETKYGVKFLSNEHSVIGNKWLFQDQVDEDRVIFRNMVRFVAQGYYKKESTDVEETFASVTNLEAITILLAFASYMNFKLFQMDVKSALLHGYMIEEVYSEEPPIYK